MSKTKTKDKPVKVADENRRITKVYGYHPASELTPDLTVATKDLARYMGLITERRNRADAVLLRDIKANGIKFPVTLRTNGQQGLITDGNHRIRIAQELGIEQMAVQVWPDSLRRIHSRAGYPMLSGEIKDWVRAHLYDHDEHDITRTQHSGGPGAGGIAPHGYLKCECDCGARWKEDA